MIIWTGMGVLVFVITFVTSLLGELLVEGLMRDPEYYQVHAWPLAVVLVISAGLIHLLARHYEAQGTGSDHTLFFIPIRYWAVIVGLLALVPLATRPL